MNRSSSSARRGAAGVATLCALALAPNPAHACGGFFCSTSPIDQAGETIVYGLEDDGTLTMSVQIRYQGDDDDFAWILPVPAPPELSVGSDALFTAIRAATDPVFATANETRGVCRPHPHCVYSDGCGSADGCGSYGGYDGPSGWTGEYVDAGVGARVDAAAPDSGPRDRGVTIFSHGDVGPYETTVLGATSAIDVIKWLIDHGYDIPTDTAPLLDSYAAGGQVFVALRLSSRSTTRMLQPIVMRMATAEACLPIRLTAIATVPDMPITAFFLGRERVIPWNFSTAEVATDDLRFWRGGRDWATEASRAIDALGGQAFVTDYAGPTPALQLELPDVADLASETDPAAFLRALSGRGYQGDARLFELFERFIEPPATEDARDYYNCLASGSTAACGEPTRFDPEGLAGSIQAEITLPRREAHALVHRHGYLTRLFTTMSAEDMTIDPVFVTDAGLGHVDNVHWANLVTECSEEYFAEDAPRHWELGDVEILDYEGPPSSDRAYCRALGGVPDYEAPVCDRSVSSDGCSFCMVAGVAPMQGGVLGGLLLVFLVRRRLRRRAP